MGSIWDDWFGFDPPEPAKINTTVTQIADIKPIVNVQTDVDMKPLADSLNRVVSVFAQQNTDTQMLMLDELSRQESQRGLERIQDIQDKKNLPEYIIDIRDFLNDKKYYIIGGMFLLLLRGK